MAKFKVDNEQIDATVETLKTLLKECEEIYEKEVPVSEVDKGQTHEELVTVCENIRTTCYYFGQLIHNTIEFLGRSSEMFATSEMNSADAIKDGGSTTHTGGSGGIHGGGGASVTSGTPSKNDEHAALMENMHAQGVRVDTTKYADATYYDYYDDQGILRKNWGVYYNTDGCTWYAYNRYQEMNPGIGHLFSGNGGGGNAENWVNSIDRNKFNVFDTSDTAVIKGNMIAVSNQHDSWEQGIRASSNHVAYVEAVKDGYVYYTDGSYPNPEHTFGYVQKVPIEVFAKDYEFVITAK